LPLFVFSALCATVVSGVSGASLGAQEKTAAPIVVRCAVIGGLVDTGLWDGLIERYEEHSGNRAILSATGPKHVIAGELARGEADLVAMHASDAIINLVADGHGENAQPWLRSDLVLVGPADDPARVRGEKDCAAALRKIIESKSKVLVHASLGANEVLADVLARAGVELPPAQTIATPSEKHRQMLQRAKAEGAYALVGRIPFIAGKIDGDGLRVMVEGDPQLRRPYLVVTTTSADNAARQQAARQFAAFLRTPETQAWIAEYGKERYDGKPLFFSVVTPEEKSPSR
jgi:tungstate transport system substrate-binding protein